MSIYTGYFAKYHKYRENYTCVSIAGRSPDFFKGVTYKKLAPKYEFFIKYKKGKISCKEFIECYEKEILSKLNPRDVLKELYELTYSEKIILLCWEKTINFCHRHLVAKWLQNELGKTIKEI